MSDSKELKRIKKLYGENFMHLCRSLFPTLLEQEGLLTKVLKSLFSAEILLDIFTIISLLYFTFLEPPIFSSA